MTLLRVAAVLLILRAAEPAMAVNKCVDVNGKVTYTDKPCAGIGQKAGMDVRGMTYSSKEVTRANNAYSSAMAQERHAQTTPGSDPQREEAARQINQRYDELARQARDKYDRLGKNFETRGAEAQVDIESQRQAALAAAGVQPDQAEINRRYDALSAETQKAYDKLGPNFGGRAVESRLTTESQRNDALGGATKAQKRPERTQSNTRVRAAAPVIDERSGTVMVPVAGGVVDPRDGTFHQETAGGYVNTKTGKFEPER